MKKCPGCGDGFVGFGKVCDVCKRRGIQFASESPAVSYGVEPYAVPEVKGHCPACGAPLRPPPLSNAERQRRWRNRHGKV